GKYLPSYHVHLVNDFTKDTKIFTEQKQHEVLLLENIRFYPGEKANDPEFAKQLAALADVYVNDGFGVCHRKDASIVSVPKFLPHYAGLLIEKEINMLDKVIHDPKKPLVAILGGSKVSTKIELITKLLQLADIVLIGGGMANTFLAAQRFSLGKSFYEPDAISMAKQLLTMTYGKKTKLVLPQDAIVQGKTIHETSVKAVRSDEAIMDIGSETQAIFGQHIATAKTIIWNGPVGKFEDPAFSRGTEFIYYAITQTTDAVSVVGGGDTLAAMKNRDYRDNITHISTGGGAMLEYIEKGTLPGLQALEKEN
ncbi:MAG: phosphoglycerate kinase, partial [Nitrosotalea sp.]